MTTSSRDLDMSAAVAVHHSNHASPSRSLDALNRPSSGSTPRVRTGTPKSKATHSKNPSSNQPMSLSTPPKSIATASSPLAPNSGPSRQSPNEDERAALQIQQLSAASAAQAYERKSPTNAGHIQYVMSSPSHNCRGCGGTLHGFSSQL